MGRLLTQIEKEALVYRMKERAEAVMRERMNNVNCDFIRNFSIYNTGGYEYSQMDRAELFKAIFVQGMFEGLGVVNQFRDELNSAEKPKD